LHRRSIHNDDSILVVYFEFTQSMRTIDSGFPILFAGSVLKCNACELFAFDTSISSG
jgi:hypothetical protein